MMPQIEEISFDELPPELAEDIAAEWGAAEEDVPEVDGEKPE